MSSYSLAPRIAALDDDAIPAASTQSCFARKGELSSRLNIVDIIVIIVSIFNPNKNNKQQKLRKLPPKLRSDFSFARVSIVDEG